jgi:dephospho-CoA kinase
MVIGLTGGIGSGKTTVAKVFETMGCAIYNSDERAKEVYFNSDVKKQVVKLLGKEAYLSRNELNKAFISQKVFSTRDILFQLNAIIHPAVNEDFKLFQSKQSPETIIVIESPFYLKPEVSKL